MNHKLCISLTERTHEKCMEHVSSSKADIVEHRLDFMNRIESLDEIYNVSEVPIIATCRSIQNGGRYNGSEEQRIKYLITAIQAGASFVDIEYGIDSRYLTMIEEESVQNECKTIISKHYHQDTPSDSSLFELIEQLSNSGADIIKVVTTPETTLDCLRTLQLYSMSSTNTHSLIAFSMGYMGRFTRLAALFLGAPFMYVSQDGGVAAASGQIPFSKMREILEVLH